MVIFNNNGMLRGVFFFYASSRVFQSWPSIPSILAVVWGFFFWTSKASYGLSFDGRYESNFCITGKAVLDTREIGAVRGGGRCPFYFFRESSRNLALEWGWWIRVSLRASVCLRCVLLLSSGSNLQSQQRWSWAKQLRWWFNGHHKQ